MRQGTSGFSLTERDDGSITIEYVDYGVSEFGGCDFEKSYHLDSTNATKLKQVLQTKYKGTLKRMLTTAFGKNFDDRAFWDLCKQHDIEYSSSTWTSGFDW